MTVSNRRRTLLALCLLPFLNGCGNGLNCWIMPEQRTIDVRDPADLPKARIPETSPPPTVSNPQTDAPIRQLSLDEAIRIALENSEVVRVLAGISAVASGRTIYDPAISNTVIDQEQARFDPRIEVGNNFNRVEKPSAALRDVMDPNSAVIAGARTDDYDFNLSLAQTTISGGTASLNVSDNLARSTSRMTALDPQNRSAASLKFEQPLLQGGGVAPNLAPIVIARIQTERSFFQFKDSAQELVRGVIDAYWAVVFARTDVWARRQQVEQARAANVLADARQRRGFVSAADVAQTRLALANFQASLVGAEANLLQREAALRNILGLPPSDSHRLVPVTPPSRNRLEINWDEIIKLAEERRPDLIELKLVIEADQQLLLQARNQALPKLNAVALYRWNGLEGETPSGAHISSGSGEFTDWTLGVNFSVPLGLRQGRAAVRQQELVIDRDRANLDQGLHSAVHDLAANTRNLAQFYEQYGAYKVAREAARINLDQQLAEVQAGRAIFLNFLQAIANWGDTVSAEAQSLTQFNTELANLERHTGTILDTHGIHFYEERLGAIGPFGRLAAPRCYPASLPAGPNTPVYPSTAKPAENAFDLQPPTKRERPTPE